MVLSTGTVKTGKKDSHRSERAVKSHIAGNYKVRPTFSDQDRCWGFGDVALTDATSTSTRPVSSVARCPEDPECIKNEFYGGTPLGKVERPAGSLYPLATLAQIFALKSFRTIVQWLKLMRELCWPARLSRLAEIS